MILSSCRPFGLRVQVPNPDFGTRSTRRACEGVVRAASNQRHGGRAGFNVAAGLVAEVVVDVGVDLDVDIDASSCAYW